jgi:hypothetical protein
MHRLKQFMYLLHYSIRSIISPLILAPQRAPQHASVTLSAMGFNLMNGYIMGGWLAEDPGRGVGELSGGRSGWLGMVSGLRSHPFFFSRCDFDFSILFVYIPYDPLA